MLNLVIEREKWGISAYNRFSTGNCWRANSDFTATNSHIEVEYQATEDVNITLEYTHMVYNAQQPGGVTDIEFEDDPRQSNRERNFFRVNWNLLAANVEWKLNDNFKINSKTFGLVAGRDALGNLGRIDRPDTPDFNGELPDRDFFNDDFVNWGNETRAIWTYDLFNQKSVFLTGTRYYEGFTERRQGLGPNNFDDDFRFLNPDNLEDSDFDLPSRNFAFFVENIFTLSPKLTVTPGFRFEYISTSTEGFFRQTQTDLAGNVLLDQQVFEDRTLDRTFPLFGVGLSYKYSPSLEFYGNISQNYRAINFNDIRTNIPGLVVDENLGDEEGYNADIGFRGDVSGLFNFDASLFYLSYNDRIGTIFRNVPDTRFDPEFEVVRSVQFRTNVGDARIYGVEFFGELNLYKLFVDKNSEIDLNLFANVGLLQSEYTRGLDESTLGNQVEFVPDINLKTGLNFSWNNLSATYQFSYLSDQFSDATNADSSPPDPSAVVGLIPSYHIMDLSLSYKRQQWKLATGVKQPF